MSKSKRALKPSQERKDKAYLLRHGEHERALWEIEAAKQGHDLAAWLRWLANRECGNLG